MFKKYLTAKTAALVGVLAFASAGAAAATGSFPSFSGARPRIESPKDDSTADTDVEDSVVDATVVDDTEVDDTVAVTDDSTDDTTDDTTDEATASTDASDPAAAESNEDDAQGPDATGPAKFGLCTAYGSRSKHDDATDDATATASSVAADEDSAELPVPFQNLEDAATAAGQTVEEFCADATPGGKPADGNGESGTGHGQSGDNPSATAPGHAEDDASVTESGDHADNPSVTAPGHNDDDSSSKSHGGGDKPADTAPGRSSGHGKS